MRKQAQAASCPFLVEIYGKYLILLALMCHNTKYFQFREVHLCLHVQGFYWSSHVGMEYFVTDPSYWVSSLSSGQVIQNDPGPMWVKTGIHHKSQCYHILSGVVQEPRYTEILFSGRIFQGLRFYLLEACRRASPFFGICRAWSFQPFTA